MHHLCREQLLLSDSSDYPNIALLCIGHIFIVASRMIFIQLQPKAATHNKSIIIVIIIIIIIIIFQSLFIIIFIIILIIIIIIIIIINRTCVHYSPLTHWLFCYGKLNGLFVSYIVFVMSSLCPKHKLRFAPGRAISQYTPC